MVVAFHATELWSDHVHAGLTWVNGALGVDIFFVLSGFVMAYATRTKKAGPHPARDFMERRLVRIAPLYWIVTALTILKLLAAKLIPKLENPGPHFKLSAGYILCSLLFIPYRNSLNEIQPIVAVGWTLTYEMFFYVLFAGSLALRVSELSFLTPIMIGLTALSVWHGGFQMAIGIWASPLLLEFLAGVLIAHIVASGFRVWNWAAGIIAVASLVALCTLPIGIFFGFAWLSRETFAILLVFCVVMLEAKIGKKIPRWAIWIGDASYSLYLVHLLVFAIVVKLAAKMGLLTFGAIHISAEMETLLLFMVPSILVSLALYRWVEAPINNALRRQLKLRNARLQPTTNP
jgi:exopolysaccharide production protein ExoZ